MQAAPDRNLQAKFLLYPVIAQICIYVKHFVLQDSNTSQIIHRIPQLIEYLSEAFTLQPGDVIITGTPSGVGAFRKPPLWLKQDDVVEIEIEGLGVLRNRCVMTS